jgi:hypothetical protein
MKPFFAIAPSKGIRCAFLVALLPVTAPAQTTWQQVQSGFHSWQLGANWSGGVVPSGSASSASFGLNPLGA